MIKVWDYKKEYELRDDILDAVDGVLKVEY